jgi:hypothetical protein
VRAVVGGCVYTLAAGADESRCVARLRVRLTDLACLAAPKRMTPPAAEADPLAELDDDNSAANGAGGASGDGGDPDFDNLLGDLADQMAGIDDMLDL